MMGGRHRLSDVLAADDVWMMGSPGNIGECTPGLYYKTQHAHDEHAEKT